MQLDQRWAEQRLRTAVVQLHTTFANHGPEGLLRLRLQPPEVAVLFRSDAADRIMRAPQGLSPTDGEQRWRMFSVLARSPLVGFCARGARLAEANGPEGFNERAFIVDRLLIIGSESTGLWGAWVDGLVLTSQGWRLLPNTPYDRQVETPRRDHTDMQLWDCDIGHRPVISRPL